VWTRGLRVAPNELEENGVEIIGTRGDDRLSGTDGADSINGLQGDDRLLGYGGDDTLVGHGGYDTLIGGAGDDVIYAGIDYDTVMGGAGDDRLVWEGGLFYYEGGKGFDTLDLRGFTGNSFWHFGWDWEGFLGGEAKDTVLVNDERGLARTLDLSGEGGDDTFAVTIEGDHRLSGGDGNDSIQSDFGTDRIDGGDGLDTLNAGTGDDTVLGGAGKDLIGGGLGADRLAGGVGRDVYIYRDCAESSAAGGVDLLSLQGDDRIDLSRIDADQTAAGDQAFVLVEALSGEAGQLAVEYDSAARVTWVRGDVDGDGLADLEISLRGAHADFDNFRL
jgi:Ca2+-binding RTX toxin-like protein